MFIFMGVRGLLSLQRESYPNVDFATAVITTVYPGSSSAEVEELITKKIEDEFRSVDHLKDSQSVSRPGLSQITIRIDLDNANTQEVIHELQKNLQNARGLPLEVLDPPKLNHIDANKDNPILWIYVSGPDKGRLRDKISWDLKSRLERINGISEIRLGSYKKREFLVLLSQEKMDRLYVSSADVISALEQKKTDVPAGYLESDKERKLVRFLGKARSLKDLGNTIIRSNFSGKKIFIKDVATIKDGSEKEIQKEYFYQSKKKTGYHLNPVTSLSISRAEGVDTLKLISDIQKSLKVFKNQLDEEYKILIGFNDEENIKRRLKSVINNALTGLALIFIVFFLFLPSRMGLLVSFSLPLSVLGTFSFFPFMGVSFNVITMLAFVICIGMLVDNSVVIAEYYSRLVVDENRSPKSSAVQSVRQFRKPITATVLTTIVAFLPMLVTTGVMGQFIKWIPIVVTLALLMSLFESFCLLPNRLLWFSQKKSGGQKEALLKRFIYWLENRFEKSMTKIVSIKHISLGSIVLLLFITILVFKWASQVDLFPSRSPEFWTARLEPQANASLPLIDKKTKQIAYQMQNVFKGDQNIQWMSVRWGTESGDILLKLKPSVLRKLKHKDILNQLRAIDKGDLKNLRFSAMKVGPPVGKPLNIAIQSNSRKEGRQFIEDILPEIKKIPGLINIKSHPDKDRGLEYRIQIQPETLARLGLSFQAVGLALRTALEGYLITELTENNESFYIRVKHDEAKISSLKDLKGIKIRERMGRLIALDEVADIQEVLSEPYRMSYNFSPVIFLQADINPKKTTSIKVNAQAQKIIEREIKNYPALSFKLVGEQEITDESLKSLFKAAVLAVFAIFIILVALFKSFFLSLLILTCIPLGLIGVVWAFLLHGEALSFFAMIGVVGLAGVVVNSAIILVSFILNLKKENPELPLSAVVIKASTMRFRPIMITNLTTLGGFFPTAYGLAGFEPLLQPMTLALFWGLFTATFLTLIWIPCAILLSEEWVSKTRKWIKPAFFKREL